MKGNNFVVSGTFNVEASVGVNSIDAPQTGRMCVSYNDGMKVYCEWPTAVINGTMMGKRTLNYTKKMKIYEAKHNVYCEMTHNPDDKGSFAALFSKSKNIQLDKVVGNLWICEPEFINKLVKKEKVKFKPETHIIKDLATIEGNWLDYLNFNGERYWSMETVRPYVLIDAGNKVLPSDSTYRTDFIHKKLDDIDKAADQKDNLEELDRKDAKIREKYQKMRKH